jgi:putative endonuclease
VLYIGVTNDLQGRLWFHRNENLKSFVRRYRCDRLVYWESFSTAADAIEREKQLKRWRREKKNQLVQRLNPMWNDLRQQLFGPEP